MKSCRSTLINLVATILGNTFGASAKGHVAAPTFSKVETYLRAKSAKRDNSPIFLSTPAPSAPRRGQMMQMRLERKHHAASLVGTGLNRAARRAEANRLRFA